MYPLSSIILKCSRDGTTFFFFGFLQTEGRADTFTVARRLAVIQADCP